MRHQPDRRLVRTILSLAPVLCAPMTRAAYDLDAVRAAVEEAGAPFTVGETSMTRLSDAQRRSRVMPHYPFPEGYGPPPRDAADAPPPRRLWWGNVDDSYFSWDDLGGACFVTPIRDQGDCGSCFTFGSLAAMETQYRVVRGEPEFFIDLSEQEVISCGLSGSCASGGTAEEVAAHLKNSGVPDESCFPYTSGSTGTDGECDRGCADIEARRHRIADWSMSVFPWSESRIKQELLNGPVISNLHIYDDFYAYTGGVYQRTSDVEGGWHIVAIVGWDDADSSWICKNSWGTDWGMQGYFKITRADDCGYDSINPLEWTGTCFASHTTVLEITEAEVHAPVLPDAGLLPDAAVGIDTATGHDAAGGVDTAAGRDATSGVDTAAGRDAASGVDGASGRDAASSTSGADAGGGTSGGENGGGEDPATAGCGCRAAPAPALIPLLLAALLWRRRRCAPR